MSSSGTFIGRVAIDASLVVMQQFWQGVLAMHVGGRDHGAVGRPALVAHADMQLHAEAPLLALAGLVHLGVAGRLLVLGRARGADEGGIQDGAVVDFEVRLRCSRPNFANSASPSL